MFSVPVMERPTFAPHQEEQAVHDLHEVLKKPRGNRGPALIGPSGEEVSLPDSVYKLLISTVNALEQGAGVTVLPVGAELTTQQAADMLNVSRPYLVGLLESCEMPFHKVGTHRRILVEDLMEYKVKRDEKRDQKLRQMSEEAQELGLYD